MHSNQVELILTPLEGSRCFHSAASGSDDKFEEEKKGPKLTWQTDTISELASGELLSLPIPKKRTESHSRELGT